MPKILNRNKEMEAYIRAHYPQEASAQIAKIFNVSASTIQNRAREMGIKRPEAPVGEIRKYTLNGRLKDYIKTNGGWKPVATYTPHQYTESDFAFIAANIDKIKVADISAHIGVSIQAVAKRISIMRRDGLLPKGRKQVIRTRVAKIKTEKIAKPKITSAIRRPAKKVPVKTLPAFNWASGLADTKPIKIKQETGVLVQIDRRTWVYRKQVV